MARELICGPLGGCPAVALRLLERWLASAAAAGQVPGCPAEQSLGWLLRNPAAARAAASSPEHKPADSVAQGATEVGADDPGGVPAVAWDAVCRVAEAIAAGLAATEAGASPQETLWALWSATDWPDRLRRTALRGGQRGRGADRDLDAVIALFDMTARLPAHLKGASGLRALLAEVSDHQVPVDQERPGPARDAVTLSSVHRTKGRAWQLVVVAGVQEGLWPDLRARGRVLGSHRLGSSGLLEAPTAMELLAAERRLMYVACTRAARRLVVTATDDPTDPRSRPSRFLAELGVPVVHHEQPAAAATPASVVTRLRLLLSHEDPEVRAAAVDRLETLAGLRARDGAALFPGAQSANWWGIRASTQADHAILPAGSPVALSGSAVSAISECPLHWFLDRRAGAGALPGPAVGIGLIMHGIAQAVADGSLQAAMAADPALVGMDELGAIEAILDAAWADLGFEASYQSAAERARASAMARTLLQWHRRSGRIPVAVELEFDVAANLGEAIRLRGAIDRVERDERGRLHLVDFKTGRAPATKAAAAANLQLAVYQLAARAGALGPAGTEVAGAELVYLSKQSAAGAPTVREQPALDPGQSWAADAVTGAAGRIRAEQFPAMVGPRCTTCVHHGLCPARHRGAEEADDHD